MLFSSLVKFSSFLPRFTDLLHPNVMNFHWREMIHFLFSSFLYVLYIFSKSVIIDLIFSILLYFTISIHFISLICILLYTLLTNLVFLNYYLASFGVRSDVISYFFVLNFFIHFLSIVSPSFLKLFLV